MLPRPRRVALLALGLLVAFTSTACSTGPSEVSSGTYRALAASPEIGATPDAQVTIDDDKVTLAAPGGSITATTSKGDDELVLCPPATRGTPYILDQPLAIGSTTFTRPAVFGDCGQTKPERITIVDLASGTASAGPFPFTRWIEFCSTADPDC